AFQPGLPLPPGGNGGIDTDRTDPAEEALGDRLAESRQQLLRAEVHDSAAQARDVEALRGGVQRYCAGRDLLTQRAGRDVPPAWVQEVAVDFIGDDHQIALDRDAADRCELLPLESPAARVVRVAKQEDARSIVDHPAETFRIDIEANPAVAQRVEDPPA